MMWATYKVLILVRLQLGSIRHILLLSMLNALFALFFAPYSQAAVCSVMTEESVVALFDKILEESDNLTQCQKLSSGRVEVLSDLFTELSRVACANRTTVTNLLGHSRGSYRSLAVAALAHSPNPQDISLLIPLLQDRSPSHIMRSVEVRSYVYSPLNVFAKRDTVAKVAQDSILTILRRLGIQHPFVNRAQLSSSPCFANELDSLLPSEFEEAWKEQRNVLAMVSPAVWRQQLELTLCLQAADRRTSTQSECKNTYLRQVTQLEPKEVIKAVLIHDVPVANEIWESMPQNWPLVYSRALQRSEQYCQMEQMEQRASSLVAASHSIAVVDARFREILFAECRQTVWNYFQPQPLDHRLVQQLLQILRSQISADDVLRAVVDTAPPLGLVVSVNGKNLAFLRDSGMNRLRSLLPHLFEESELAEITRAIRNEMRKTKTPEHGIAYLIAGLPSLPREERRDAVVELLSKPAGDRELQSLLIAFGKTVSAEESKIFADLYFSFFPCAYIRTCQREIMLDSLDYHPDRFELSRAVINDPRIAGESSQTLRQLLKSVSLRVHEVVMAQQLFELLRGCEQALSSPFPERHCVDERSAYIEFGKQLFEERRSEA